MPAIDDASGDLPVTGSLVVPAAAQHWRFSRSSGPGGQGVNTADSRVELSVAPLELPGLTGVQRERLAAVLRAALAPPPPVRRRTKPTRGSQERRIQAKKQRGELKRSRRRWD